MLWVQRLRDGLDEHERVLETRITPTLMIHLLWRVHQDSRQFFNGCEKWDDGHALPRSTLPSAVRALVDEIDITTTLTCPVKEFLGPDPATSGSRPREKREGRGTDWGRQPTRNVAIPHICAPSVRELNRLYPSMSILTFAKTTGVKYHDLAVGAKGDCTNFGLLGRCPDENCRFRHAAVTVPDARQVEVKASLDRRLAVLAGK